MGQAYAIPVTIVVDLPQRKINQACVQQASTYRLPRPRRRVVARVFVLLVVVLVVGELTRRRSCLQHERKSTRQWGVKKRSDCSQSALLM